MAMLTSLLSLLLLTAAVATPPDEPGSPSGDKPPSFLDFPEAVSTLIASRFDRRTRASFARTSTEAQALARQVPPTKGELLLLQSPIRDDHLHLLIDDLYYKHRDLFRQLLESATVQEIALLYDRINALPFSDADRAGYVQLIYNHNEKSSHLVDALRLAEKQQPPWLFVARIAGADPSLSPYVERLCEMLERESVPVDFLDRKVDSNEWPMITLEAFKDRSDLLANPHIVEALVRVGVRFPMVPYLKAVPATASLEKIFPLLTDTFWQRTADDQYDMEGVARQFVAGLVELHSEGHSQAAEAVWRLPAVVQFVRQELRPFFLAFVAEPESHRILDRDETSTALLAYRPDDRDLYLHRVCKQGNLKAVRQVADRVDLRAEDGRGRRPLSCLPWSRIPELVRDYPDLAVVLFQSDPESVLGRHQEAVRRDFGKFITDTDFFAELYRQLPDKADALRALFAIRQGRPQLPETAQHTTELHKAFRAAEADRIVKLIAEGSVVKARDGAGLVPFQYCSPGLLNDLLRRCPPDTAKALVQSEPTTFVQLACEMLSDKQHCDGIQSVLDSCDLFRNCLPDPTAKK